MSQASRALNPGPTPGGDQERASVSGASAALARPAASKTITETRHLSLELKKDSTNVDAGPVPSNRYTIYDLKSVKREILTIFDAAENGDNRSITKFSKGKNFDVDAKDRYGRTALIWAADCGHIHSIETLIRLGASVHASDSHTGRTAIHWAARAGNLPIVKLLVQYGVNYKKEDRFGLTPLFLAKSKGYEGEDVFKYLLGEGAPYNETKVINDVDVATIEAEIAAEMAKFEAEDTKFEATSN